MPLTIQITVETKADMVDALTSMLRDFSPESLDAKANATQVPMSDVIDGLNDELAKQGQKLVIVTLDPQAGEPEPAKKTTRKKRASKKAANKEDKPDTDDSDDSDDSDESDTQAAPAAAAEAGKSPDEILQQAIEMLMVAFSDPGKKEAVMGLLDKYGVRRFVEIPPDRAGELLADAKALGA